ncbi:MAG: hypothetical protein ACPLXA_01255 [Moorellaceae bacterium]
MKWEELKEQLMKDPSFRKEYDELEPEYQLVRAIIHQRTPEGLEVKNYGPDLCNSKAHGAQRKWR